MWKTPSKVHQETKQEKRKHSISKVQNKIENRNGECVKETTTRPWSRKQTRPPMGLQHSVKILHPKVVLIPQ